MDIKPEDLNLEATTEETLELAQIQERLEQNRYLGHISDKNPGGLTMGDRALNSDPTKPLSPRHKEFARLLFLGKPSREIAQRMQFHPQYVSILASNTRIRLEVARLQELAFERTVGERLKDLGPVAMDVIEESLYSTEMKLRERVGMAQWVVEKLDGKAGQKIDIQSTSLEKFMQTLTEMRSTGETLDVTPTALPATQEAIATVDNESATSEEPIAPEETDWGSWLSTNMP